MNYYIITNECVDCPIINNKQYLEEHYPQLEVKELPEDYNYNGNYIIVDGELVKNPDYEKEQVQKRQDNFEAEFIETSMKDSKGNNAWYRQVPHGYANAPQTIELVDKYVRDAQGMTEQIALLLIFYEKPDFAKAEECTEEWLIQHQFNPPVNMTLQQWLDFEMDFQIRWANLKYKQQQAQQ